MHVVQLFFELIAAVNFKGIILRQPKSTVVLECLPVFGCILSIPFSNPQTTLTFPLVHECAELSGLRKPQNRMNVVGHDHEADAFALAFFQSAGQHTEENPPGMIVIEQSASVRDTECDKVCVETIIEDTTSIHPIMLPGSCPQINPNHGRFRYQGGLGWSEATTRVATATRSRVKCQPCRSGHADWTCSEMSAMETFTASKPLVTSSHR